MTSDDQSLFSSAVDADLCNIVKSTCVRECVLLFTRPNPCGNLAIVEKDAITRGCHRVVPDEDKEDRYQTVKQASSPV